MTDTTPEPVDPRTAAQLDAADTYDGRGDHRTDRPVPPPDPFSEVIERRAEQDIDARTGDHHDPDSLYGGQES